MQSCPMTYAVHRRDRGSRVDGGAPSQHEATATKKGILRRVVEAISEWRQWHANQEVDRFLARSGGRFTDEIERRLTDV